MAIFSAPFYGDVRKRIGNITTYTLKGQKIARSIPIKTRDPKTPAQLRHREKIKYISGLSAKLTNVLQNGFPERTVTSSPRNAFIKKNFSFLETDDENHVSLPWEKLSCSSGSLGTPTVKVRYIPASQNFIFMQEELYPDSHSHPYDCLYAAIIDTKNIESIFLLLRQRNNPGRTEFHLTGEIDLKDIRIYVYALSPNGKKASDSLYLQPE